MAKGVTGYSYHTVPVAVHAWLSHPTNFKQAVTTMIQCGGDADTTAAIVGGIVGAGVGSEGIPANLLNGIFETPPSVRWMRILGEPRTANRWPTPPKVKRPNPSAVLTHFPY